MSQHWQGTVLLAWCASALPWLTAWKTWGYWDSWKKMQFRRGLDNRPRKVNCNELGWHRPALSEGQSAEQSLLYETDHGAWLTATLIEIPVLWAHRGCCPGKMEGSVLSQESEQTIATSPPWKMPPGLKSQVLSPEVIRFPSSCLLPPLGRAFVQWSANIKHCPLASYVKLVKFT